MSDGYSFGGVSNSELADLLTEQTNELETTGAKHRTAVLAGDPDRTATLEAEVLSGFELVESIRTELNNRLGV